MEQERERQANEKLKAALHQLDSYLVNIKEKNALIEKIEAELLQQHSVTPIDDEKKISNRRTNSKITPKRHYDGRRLNLLQRPF